MKAFSSGISNTLMLKVSFIKNVFINSTVLDWNSLANNRKKCSIFVYIQNKIDNIV